MDYKISDNYKVNADRNSKGCQIKYKRNKYWYKIDGKCNEGLNEHISSLILNCSNLRITDFVYYERCTVNGKNACRSLNFLKSDEIFVPLQNIICDVHGVRNAEDFIWSRQDITDRFRVLVNTVLEYTGNNLNISEYLTKVFYFDMLIINRDRHLNNLGIIISDNGHYRAAPIFDNGLSLLGGCQGYILEEGIEGAINKQNARTISGSFVEQVLATTSNRDIRYMKSPFKVNFNRLWNCLNRDKYVTGTYINVLKHQCKNLGNIYI